MIHRRSVFAAAGAVMSSPSLAQAPGSRVLKFVPQADLAVLDPITTAAVVTRNHAALVFDTLYGVDDRLVAHPQMAEGHTTDDGGKIWTIRLREGLVFHDGTPVLARDVIASLRRWARRDSYGDALFRNTEELAALDDRTLRLRLRAPMGNLPYILGKEGPYLAAIMPERLAATDVSRQVPELVGSGPYRYVAAERVSGVRNVYQRWERYVPRPNGTPNFLSGPKVPHIERVEWHTIPDAGTAAATLRSGEMDWWERPTIDLLPLLRHQRGVKVDLFLKDGSMAVLKLNHLHAPFDNPKVRRALLPAIDQATFMMAARGPDRSGWEDNVGFFLPGSPMATTAGLEAMTSPRSLEAAKRALGESGYGGEPTALLLPSDYFDINAFGEVAADVMRNVGFNLQRMDMDWGSVIQRVPSQRPLDQGGWNAFPTTMPGAYTADPVVNWYLRGNGRAGATGWPTSERIESLRSQWLTTADEAQQRALCADIQKQAFEDVPHLPLGRFFQPTAFRTVLQGLSNGFPTFYNIRKS